MSLADVITRCNRFDQMQETRQLTVAKSAEVHAVRGHRRFRGGRTRGTSEQKHQNQHVKSSRGHGRMPVEFNIILNSTNFHVITVGQSMDQDVALRTENHAACVVGLDILIKCVVLCGMFNKIFKITKTLLC